MEYLLHQGEIGFKQDILIYGRKYHVWCEGIYLGEGTYTDDEYLEDVFLGNTKTPQGEEAFDVYFADEWKLI